MKQRDADLDGEGACLASLSTLPPSPLVGTQEGKRESTAQLGGSQGGAGTKCAEINRTGFVVEPKERLDRELTFEPRSLGGGGRGHRGNDAGTTINNSSCFRPASQMGAAGPSNQKTEKSLMKGPQRGKGRSTCTNKDG